MTDALTQARELFLADVAHAEAGRLDAAERAFEAALARAPGRPSVLANLGVVRVRQGRPAQALAPLAEALRSEPEHLAAWLHQGLAQAALGLAADALTSIDRALALAPDHAGLHVQRAAQLVRLDRADAALAALDRALSLAPNLADAWSQRGSLLRDAGQFDAAAESYERALAAGADPTLHRYYLAAVRAGAEAAPDAPPRAYVETLFDQYAADFDQHLVHTLGYRGHERVVDAVAQLGARQYASALDLGCGTGLCGPLLRRIASRVDGVDLSAAMLEKARACGAYTTLAHADVADYLRTAERRDDLVVAADVFIYVGRLETVFEGVARILVAGGAFCFTVEAADDGDEVRLLPSLRYAHSAGYVRRLAAQHGFEVAALARGPLREEQQADRAALYASLVRR